MSRARSDRNIVKFGPAPSALDPDLKSLSDENRRLQFRLKRQILASPELAAPEPGPVGPSPIVIPSDLATAIPAGFPYDFKNAFPMERIPSSRVPYVFKFENVSTNSSILTLPTGDSVSFVEFPSGAATSVPFSTNTRGFLDVGNQIVVTGYSDKLGEVYNKETGVFTDLLSPVDDINFYKNLGYSLYNNFSQFDDYVFTFDKKGVSKPFLLNSSPEYFFIFRSALLEGRQFISSRATVYITAHWLHAYDRNNLDRYDFLLYSSKGSGDYGAPLRTNPIPTNEWVVWLSGFGFGSSDALVFSETAANFISKDKKPPYPEQAERGFVDSQNRIVYMHYNDETNLWEIHRMSPSGVKSILPLVFSGNPQDQPTYGSGSADDFYQPFSFGPTVNSSDLIPGICQAPDGGYFIYGSLDTHFGEFTTREGGTVLNTPVFRKVPAIWYTNGTQTQRVWTFQGTEENPILELGVSNSEDYMPRVTFAEYDEITRSLNFSVYLQNQRLYVASVSGDNVLQNITSTIGSANLLLYRVQL